MDMLRGTAFGELIRQADSMEGHTPAEKFAAYERDIREQFSSFVPGSSQYSEAMGLLGLVAAIGRGIPKLERSSFLAPTGEERIAAIAA
ncbi:MAG TPA: hypothetical protein VJA87_02350 [Candidatus Paceibacterota bacterium]